MDFYARITRAEGHVLLSACDSYLIGRVFRGSGVVLDVSKSYYGQRLIDGGELRSLLSRANIINLVGENAIAVAEELGLCRKNDAKFVSGVPHINIYYV